VLQRVAVCRSMLQCFGEAGDAAQHGLSCPLKPAVCVAVCCSEERCVVVCCGALQQLCFSVLQCAAVCCSVLQCVAE